MAKMCDMLQAPPTATAVALVATLAAMNVTATPGMRATAATPRNTSTRNTRPPTTVPSPAGKDLQAQAEAVVIAATTGELLLLGRMGNPANIPRMPQNATAARADDATGANTTMPTAPAIATVMTKTSGEKETTTENDGTTTAGRGGTAVDTGGKWIHITRRITGRRRNGSQRAVRPTVAAVAILSGATILLLAVKKRGRDNRTVRSMRGNPRMMTFTMTAGYEQVGIVTATRTTIEAWRLEIAVTVGTVLVGGKMEEGNLDGGKVIAALEVSAGAMKMKALATVAAETAVMVVELMAVVGGAVVRRRGKNIIIVVKPTTTGTAAAAGGTRMIETRRTKTTAMHTIPVITTTTAVIG